MYSANEYLTRVNLMGAWTEDADTPVLKGQRVAVIGGGNVAMDSVRTARRMGAEEARIVYRRGREELPARAEEVHHAEQEGIRFDFLTAPVEVLGDENGWVTGLRCRRVNLGEPDDHGRRIPTPIPGSEFDIACDMIVVAIGTRSNPLLTATAPELQVNEWGYMVIDEHGMTSMPGVFAGGDIVRGAATRHPGHGRRQAGRGRDGPLADAPGRRRRRPRNPRPPPPRPDPAIAQRALRCQLRPAGADHGCTCSLRPSGSKVLTTPSG